MKPKSILLVLAVSVSALACAETMERERGAVAPGAMTDRSVTTFAEIDTNNSGYVELGEASAAGLQSSEFQAHDIDADGRLDADEFEAAFAGSPGRQEAIGEKK